MLRDYMVFQGEWVDKLYGVLATEKNIYHHYMYHRHTRNHAARLKVETHISCDILWEGMHVAW